MKILGSGLSVALLAAGLAFAAPLAQAQHKAGGIILEYRDIDVALVANGWRQR